MYTVDCNDCILMPAQYNECEYVSFLCFLRIFPGEPLCDLSKTEQKKIDTDKQSHSTEEKQEQIQNCRK